MSSTPATQQRVYTAAKSHVPPSYPLVVHRFPPPPPVMQPQPFQQPAQAPFQAHMMRPIPWATYQQNPQNFDQHVAHGPSTDSTPSTPQRTQGWFPDVYSTPFVSEHQRSINNISALTVRAQPPPCVDFAGFIDNFAGKGFLTQLAPIPPYLGATNMQFQVFNTGMSPAGKRKSITGSPGIRKKASKEGGCELNPSNYRERFLKLLGREIAIEDQTSRSYNLYNVPVIPQDITQYLFQVSVPGIRENTPMVQLGDMIRLRQIRPPPLLPGYPPVFTGYEYEAYVYGMDKSVGYIVLRADGLWIEHGAKFNVIFGVQENRWYGARRAVEDIGESLHTSGSDMSDENPKSPERCFLKRMLFPEKIDGVMQYKLSRGVFGRKLFDKDLNYEQQKAVDSILRQDYGSVPFLISGPPGTGKTKTIVETVLQLIYAPRTPRHHILLCAPSQEAADTLAVRLAKHLSPSALFRLQTSTRTFSEVPTKLMSYSYIENDMFAIPAWRALMRFRVVVCSCRDADILVQARCTNRDLGRWEKSVVDSLRGISEDSSEFVERGENVHLHWSALLLDEAAQGMEPEVAIPLSVVAPPEEASDNKPIVVMAGDQRQLGPTTLTKSELQTSAFERLFRRSIYSEHPWRRELYTDYGMEGTRERLEEMTADRRAQMLPCLYPPFANLVRNYRSHPAILAVPSAFFYNDTLIPEAKNTNKLEGWCDWKGSRGIPVKMILNSGHDESHEEAVSFYNLREVQIAVNTVQSLLSPDSWPSREVPIAPNEIAVMSPFREQVKRLRKALRIVSLKHVNVGPVEAYQGAEYRFVIICTTRARERFLKNDKEKGFGVIFEHRRANVALTRAKEGLVVIGNPWILERDSIWMEWMSFAWRHDAVEFDPEDHPTPLVVDPQKDHGESKKENHDPKAPTSPVSSTPRTYASVISSGRTRPVNEWRPRGGDIETSGLVSRLETALVFKSKAREGAVFGLNAGWDEDDPMFLAGIVAEDEVRRHMEEQESGDSDGAYGVDPGV